MIRFPSQSLSAPRDTFALVERPVVNPLSPDEALRLALARAVASGLTSQAKADLVLSRVAKVSA